MCPIHVNDYKMPPVWLIIHLEEERGKKLLINNKEIKIQNGSIYLKFMRSFGDFITELDFCLISISVQKFDKFKHYLNEYCSDSVVNFVYCLIAVKNPLFWCFDLHAVF